MKLTFDKVKEIADRYGIGVKEVPEGEGGFIYDETGTVHEHLPMQLIGQIADVPELLFRGQKFNSDNIIQGQHLEDVGMWDIKHDNNFFIYDTEGNLIFEAYSYHPQIESTRTTKEYRNGEKNQVIWAESYTNGIKITL